MCGNVQTGRNLASAKPGLSADRFRDVIATLPHHEHLRVDRGMPEIPVRTCSAPVLYRNDVLRELDLHRFLIRILD